jgi:hypothetical protein
MTVELGWDAINDSEPKRVIRFDAQSQFDLLERLGLEEPDWRAGTGARRESRRIFVALTVYLGWTFRPPQRSWPARLHELTARRLRKAASCRVAPKDPCISAAAEAACPDLARNLDEIRPATPRCAYGPRRRSATCSDSSTPSTRCAPDPRAAVEPRVIIPAKPGLCFALIIRATHMSDKKFEAAAQDIRKLTKRPDDEDMLRLYALYKQATGRRDRRQARCVLVLPIERNSTQGSSKGTDASESQGVLHQARRAPQEDVRLSPMRLAIAAILAAAIAVLVALVVPPCCGDADDGRFYCGRDPALQPVLGAQCASVQSLRGDAAAPRRAHQHLPGREGFVGCNGQVITDEIRITIAAQACLLLLGRPGHVYDELQSILVYPSVFWVDDEVEGEDGVVTRRRRELSGEAWDSHRIILSWEDIEETAQVAADGYNVVLHEFAHYLDAEGLGLARAGANRTRSLDAWLAELRQQYAHLRAGVARTPVFLDLAGRRRGWSSSRGNRDFIDDRSNLRAANAANTTT